jgi:hypothetical protein
MTISTQTNKTIALGNGATTVFNYSFFLDDAAHMYVVYTDTAGNEIVVTSGQYTLTGVGVPTGGTLTLLFGSPIALGTKLTMMRVLPFTQPLDIVNQDGFYAEVIEDGFDNLEMQIQQVNGNVGLSLRLDVSETNWDFKGHRGINLGLPINLNDATNKTYVDSQIQAYLIAGSTVLVNLTFDTVAAAQVATPPLIVNAITTLGYSTRGVGGQRYLRRASMPAHPGYITTHGGTIFWELDRQQVVSFEALGVVADGIVDDTAAVKNIGLVIDSWKEGRFKAPTGNKVSSVWPNDASAVANPTLWNLTSVNGLEIDFSGWSYTTGYTGNITTSFCIYSNCKNFDIRGYKANHPAHVPFFGATAYYGVNHWSGRNGSKYISIRDVDIIGGVNGLYALRVAGSADAQCEYLVWTGTFQNVGYPISCQNSGNHIRFDIKTSGQYRAFDFYGVHDLYGFIDSKNFHIDDLVVAAFYTDVADTVNVTRDVYIRYQSRGNNIGPMGSLIALTHQQYGGLATVAGGSKIHNIHIELDCEYDSLNAPGNGIVNHSWVLASILGQPTVGFNEETGIKITGVITNGGFYLGGGGAFWRLFAAGNGWTAGGTHKSGFEIGPLDARLAGGVSEIGQGTWVHFDHFIAPNVAPGFAGVVDWHRITIIASIMDGYGKLTSSFMNALAYHQFLPAASVPVDNGVVWFDGTNFKVKVAGVVKTFTLV